ncbi:MAG: hypothetical protein FDX18_10215 [Chlorobium sp.]|nr:MAG: hypothetical protein FDX18_10215 [Chlorobium sp.]
MLLFSTRFGSEDPFVDALQAARWLGEHDAMNVLSRYRYCKWHGYGGLYGHSGEVYGIGRPLILAAGCARLKPRGDVASLITFPAAEWSQLIRAKGYYKKND